MTADLIRAVEAAYDLDVDHAGWLRKVSEALAPSLGLGYGLSATFWHRAGAGVLVSSGHLTACPSEVVEMLNRITRGLGADMVDLWCSPVPRVVQFGADDTTAAHLATATAGEALPLRGIVALSVGDGSGAGCAIAAPSPRRAALSARPLRAWRRVSAHIASGLRLRMSLSRGSLTPAAVLGEDGAVLDATHAAQSRDTREALRAAVREMHRARGQLRTTNPEESLDLWRALVDGRFSVVDWVDTDGRRFLVAYDNGVATSDPRALSTQERGVAEYFAGGASNADIAYYMGLAPGTVSRLARDVLRKLGCERRADLAALFGGKAMLASQTSSSLPLVVLGPAERNAELLKHLTQAQREVIALALEGRSDSEIAAARGVSARTVTSQMASAYARLSCATRSELSALFGAAPSAANAR